MKSDGCSGSTCIKCGGGAYECACARPLLATTQDTLDELRRTASEVIVGLIAAYESGIFKDHALEQARTWLAENGIPLDAARPFTTAEVEQARGR